MPTDTAASVTLARCERDLSTAVAAVARFAHRPTGGWTAAAEDALFLAAFRLRDAYEARQAATVLVPDDPRMTKPSSSCAVPWCEGNCEPRSEDEPSRLHTRRWPLTGAVNAVELVQLEAGPGEPIDPHEAAPVIWLDHGSRTVNMPHQLTIDEAGRLAEVLTAAVAAARGAER